jgi:hypothetical protein
VVPGVAGAAGSGVAVPAVAAAANVTALETSFSVPLCLSREGERWKLHFLCQLSR